MTKVNNDKRASKGARGGRPARARRTQEERRAETREALINAAIHVIAEIGYTATTTSMIAKRASVSRGALQYHFASKADLTVAIMEAIATELNLRFDVSGLARAPLETRLAQMIEHYWQVFQGPMFRAGLSIWMALAGDRPLAARVEASMKHVRQGISSVWHELFRDVPCSTHELETVLHIVMAAMRGSAITFVAGRASSDFRDERRQLCQMAFNTLRQFSARSAQRSTGAA